jgi:hypothetical protein
MVVSTNARITARAQYLIARSLLFSLSFALYALRYVLSLTFPIMNSMSERMSLQATQVRAGLDVGCKEQKGGR